MAYTLKRIKSTTYKISILTGALFFLSLSAYSLSFGPATDSLSQADTLKASVISEGKIQQKQDTISNDTLNSYTVIADSDNLVIGDSILQPEKPKRIPSPQRATILSAVIPGLGQAYNYKYWKIPIIYSVGIGLYYYYDYKNDIYLEYLKLWREAATNSPEKNTYANAKDGALSQRGYALIFIGILYFANIVDAMTDAYFLQYDISDDLTVDIKPALMQNYYQPGNFLSYGINISVNF